MSLAQLAVSSCSGPTSGHELRCIFRSIQDLPARVAIEKLVAMTLSYWEKWNMAAKLHQLSAYRLRLLQFHEGVACRQLLHPLRLGDQNLNSSREEAERSWDRTFPTSTGSLRSRPRFAELLRLRRMEGRARCSCGGFQDSRQF